MIALEFFYFILIGICAGWLAGQITKSTGAGVLGDLVIGVIGAIVGGWVFGLLGLASTSLIGSLIMATVGAVLLILGLRWVSRKTK